MSGSFRHSSEASPLARLLPYVAAFLMGALLVTIWFGNPVDMASRLIDPPTRTGRSVATQSFALCTAPPHVNCVIDGDTFYLRGQSIRIADIDAPETHPARCTREAQLGERATRRLAELLNARAFDVTSYERDTDKYGRKLRIIARDGHSIGGILVSEGLARPWGGKRAPWCG